MYLCTSEMSGYMPLAVVTRVLSCDVILSTKSPAVIKVYFILENLHFIAYVIDVHLSTST